MMHRRQMRAPYYVADTMEAAGGYYLEDPHHPASWHPQIPTHAYRSHHHLSMIGQPRHHFELMVRFLISWCPSETNDDFGAKIQILLHSKISVAFIAHNVVK